VRGATIGFEYIIRGGRNKRVYAEDLVTNGLYRLCAIRCTSATC
jgi:hypothetical protein